MSSPTPRAAYVHVPFCRHRCGYCNFTVVAGRDELSDRYLAAIERELSWLGQPHPVDTLFCGGGTPSHLSPRDLSRLCELLTNWFPLAEEGEFSVEANPEDIEPARVSILRDAAVNRVSLGVQSFDAEKLNVLERAHREIDVRRCFELLRPHVTSLSFDLIFAAPGETLAVWQKDLETALAQQPDHISTYGLTYERGARFWSQRAKGLLPNVDEDLERAMYELAIDMLTDAGFEHYEVSNFARPGHRCRHNETYWLGDEYFGIGPGAARYVAGRREVNHRSTTGYLRRVLDGQPATAESEALSPEDRARERLVFGLRRLEGIDCQAFEQRTGFSVLGLVGDSLSRFLEAGFLEQANHQIRLTRRGLLVSDSIWPEFLRI